MKSNGLLKFFSVLLLAAAIGMIVFELQKTASLEISDPALTPALRLEAGTIAGDPVAEVGAPAEDGVVPGEGADSGTQVGEVPTSRLAVGVLGATPDRDQIHTISELPWLDSEANRAFNESRDFACQLLIPDTAVKPPMTRPGQGRSGLLGRIPTATVGLEVDEASKLKMPRASRGAIEGYLRDHRLVIEPTVYQDGRGQAYFGTDCRAAFYQTAYPTITVKAEGMIEEAIGRFRALGVLREDPASFGRTLVMAFRFIQQEGTMRSIGSPQAVTELMFFHLATNESSNLPSIQVFVTSDSRQSLHRLTKDASIIDEPMPMISATIRFEKFILMGLYPANPIVTGVRQRSAAVMSLDTIRKLTATGAAEDRLTFQQLLDQFSSITSKL